MSLRSIFEGVHNRVRMTALVVALAASVLLPARSYAQLAAGQNKFFGNIIGSNIPWNFNTYWNQVTPENAGKWGSVAASKDTNSWNWSDLMMTYDYAVSNGFPFKDHNLVWGQQQPSWITSLDSAGQAQIVGTWIRLCGEKLPQASFVDVVNEPLHAPPPYVKALGGNGTTGWDWVIWVFQKARQYFPNAKLLINEYSILSSQANTNSYIKIINILKSRNLIDGIGCQGHSLEATDTNTIKGNLSALAATGLPIFISEYDVNESDDNTQLRIYQQQFPIFWKSPAVKGITLWGYIEGQIWRTDAYLVRYDNSERPALAWLRQYIASNPDEVERTHESFPTKYILNQNFPNPFNPSTIIRYDVPKNSVVKVAIYDLLGREVTDLVDGIQSANTYSVAWSPSHLSGGIYFCRIQARSLDGSSNFTSVKKLVYMK